MLFESNGELLGSVGAVEVERFNDAIVEGRTLGSDCNVIGGTVVDCGGGICVLFADENGFEFERFNGSNVDGPDGSIAGCEIGSVRLSFARRVDGLVDKEGDPVCCVLFVGDADDSAIGICVLLGRVGAFGNEKFERAMVGDEKGIGELFEGSGEVRLERFSGCVAD